MKLINDYMSKLLSFKKFNVKETGLLTGLYKKSLNTVR